MVLDNTKSQAKAAVSEAHAEVKRLESDLSTAHLKLKLVTTGDKAVDTVTSVPGVQDQTEFLRQKTDAQVAAAQAEVDRVQAELDQARSKLKWAESTQRGVHTVADTIDDVKDATRAALEDEAGS